METVVEPSADPVKTLGRLNNWFNTAAVFVFKGILLFLLLNLILYLISLARRPAIAADPFGRYGEDRVLKAYPGWREEDVKTLLRETYSDLVFQYEPFTEFRNKPFRGKYVNIDPTGFRFSKDQAPWPPRPEATNVFVFGGSTAFGIGLPDEETIASYLQGCAPANHSTGRLAVYNFGRPSYFSSQELILFQQLLTAGFVPQVAVFIDGMNEFGFGFPSGEPRFAGRFRRLMAGEIRTSPFDNVPVVQAAHWLRGHWTKPAPQKVGYDADRAALEGVISRWLANKRMIEVMAGGFGVRPIFVWQPVPMHKYDLHYHLFYSSDYVFGSAVRGRGGYSLMENLRAQGKLGPNVLWLADMQQDKHKNLYVDALHYNPPFSKEIAARICGFLNDHRNVK